MVRRSLASPRSGKTDWDRVDALRDEEIETAVAGDPDAAPIVDEAWFDKARLIEPPAKEAISIRLDKDVLEFFRATSGRYQTQINAVLRAYMESRRR